ncbi:MAG: HPr family phosphocarrier protein [Kiritimatiellae bacterium]|nr:HPr family phosphocarrier protein [Kiritimatiellia bacterium]MBR4251742.1 HPr family phosphocarrier protein [Kiritimatiellia bacterium]
MSDKPQPKTEKKAPAAPGAPAGGPHVRRVTVLNRYGIHARPASLLVKAASRHPCDIYIEKEGLRVNAKSIMGLLTLEGHCGAVMVLTAEGPEAAEALDEMVDLFEKKFFED